MLLGPSQASGQAVSGTIVIEPNPAGETKSDLVTFRLPRRVRIGGTTYVLPTPGLAGTHTCTLDPTSVDSADTTGHHIFFARLYRGSKLGSVFTGRLTAGAGTLLLQAGCDGDPSTVDDFQGDATSLFAELAIFAAQALTATENHPDGKSTKEEIIEDFLIEDGRDVKIIQVTEFHGFEFLNRGGSATGLASAKIRLVFKPS